MWSKGTEKNLKLIETFFPWEVSPDQNTLQTLCKRLEEISGFSQFTSNTHINFQVRKLSTRWMSTRHSVIPGDS